MTLEESLLRYELRDSFSGVSAPQHRSLCVASAASVVGREGVLWGGSELVRELG